MDETKALQLVLAEEGGRFRVFGYSRQDRESKDGTVLLPRAAFRAGPNLNKFVRLQLPARAVNVPGQASGGPPTPRHALVYGAIDGSLGFLAPLDEAVYRRLFFLGTKMVTTLPHVAGLNPRGFRAHQAGATGPRELKNVLDTVLLRRFTSLDRGTQERLAQQIGTTLQQLLTNLAELDQLIDLL